jgi:SAM-dependent methyltransferase
MYAPWGDADPQFFENLYGRDYFYGDEYADYLADAELHRRNARLHLSSLLNVMGKGRERGALLEVGCAYGFFLREADERGFAAEGIDISPEAVEYASQHGLQVTEASLDTFMPSRTFRVACMWDTIEHLPRPIEALEKVGKLVESGGWLALSTGDLSSYIATARGARWRMIHPPTHLHYFTRSSVGAALDRAGFDLVTIEYSGRFRALPSVVRNIGALKSRDVRRLVRLLEIIPVVGTPIYTNLRDVMTVIGQRRDDSA